MNASYSIDTLPLKFVDREALLRLTQFCRRPDHRVALIGFNETAKHLVNLCGDQIAGFHDPSDRKSGISFRGRRVVALPGKLDATHLAVCDHALAYEFAVQVSDAYGGVLPVFVPPRLDQKPTAKIDPFTQETFYRKIFAQAADAPISMMDRQKICFLMEMLRHALRLPGDVIEMGVWQGGVRGTLQRSLLNRMRRDRYICSIFSRLCQIIATPPCAMTK